MSNRNLIKLVNHTHELLAGTEKSDALISLNEFNKVSDEKKDLVDTIEAMLRAAAPNGSCLTDDELEEEVKSCSSSPSDYIKIRIEELEGWLASSNLELAYARLHGLGWWHKFFKTKTYARHAIGVYNASLRVES